MPLTINTPPLSLVITEEQMLAAFPGLFGTQAMARQVESPPEQPAGNKTEQSIESAVPSDEALLALVKQVADTPALGITHVQGVLKSLGAERVSLLDEAGRLAFATALRDALALRAAK